MYLRGPSRRVHDFIPIWPGDHKKVANHLATKGETNPFVHDRNNEFTDELGRLAGLGGGRKDETIGNIMDGFNKTIEVDALIRV